MLISNWKNSKNILYLGTALIIFSIYSISVSLLTDGGPVWLLAVVLNNFAPLYYLHPVLLYFYVRTIFTDSIRFKKYDFLHFLPFIINLIAIIPYLFTPWDYKYAIAEKLMYNFDAYMAYDFKLFYPHFMNQLLRPLQFFIYLVACVILAVKKLPELKKLKGMEKKQFYNVHFSIAVILLFFVFINISHIHFALNNYIQHDTYFSHLLIQNKLRLISGIYFVVPLFIMLNPRFTYGMPRKKEIKSVDNQNHVEELTDKQNVENNTNYLKVKEDDYFKTLSMRILTYIEDEKPYQNPDFSVENVCTELKVPRHHVQYCFNIILEKKFVDFKNECRVNYAMELLTNESNKNISIEGIGKLSGFASASNFFSVFKKVTGVSPNQWLHNSRNNLYLIDE